ncbi:hypothetical protein QTI66_34260 [Variovorax sp. J22R133]|uniref:hypothetical protein n=1 Tax=Variovorax brevis TaxID=3053503 RepID=UPI0025750111|nr:hypothetical protein [Variovorax sp. J22R133]MDM0117188.1 hypothetical protein [Variovorax sp. J22R133]
MDDIAADPFCGFSLGSTVYRAVADEDAAPLKFAFESPLVRLSSEYQYKDVYEMATTFWTTDGSSTILEGRPAAQRQTAPKVPLPAFLHAVNGI